MPLLNVILVLVVVGILLWLLGIIPMDGTIKQIIKVIVIIAVVLWLLSLFGLLPNLRSLRIGG